MTINIDEILHTPIGSLAKYSAADLSKLMQQATSNLETAKRAKSWVELAIKLKYEEQIKEKRLQLGKDSGVIHLEDAGFKLTATTAKRVEWNQRELQKVIAQLLARGANMDDFVITLYKVPERKYKGWSGVIQEMFAAARIVHIGSTSYELKKLDNVSVEVSV